MVYIIVMLFSICGALLYTRVSKRGTVYIWGSRRFEIRYQKVFAWFCVFFPLFFVSAVRYGVGTDYFYTYTPIYNRIRGGTGFNEVGFTWLTEQLTKVSDDPQILFVVTSLVTVGITTIFLCRYSTRPALSVFLYVIGGYYLFGLSGVRQALATAIFVFSIQYIQQRKVIKYYICILVAASIHTMALGYLAAYFLYRIDWKPKTRIMLVCGAFAIRPLLSKFIRLIISYTPYSWYIGSKYDRNEDALLLQLMCIGLFAFGLLAVEMSRNLESNCREDAQFYLNLHMIGVVCSSLIGVVPVGGRVTYLTFFMAFASVPSFLNLVSKRRNRIIMEMLLIAAFIVYWVYVYFLHNAEGVLPYQSIFS